MQKEIIETYLQSCPNDTESRLTEEEEEIRTNNLVSWLFSHE